MLEPKRTRRASRIRDEAIAEVQQEEKVRLNVDIQKSKYKALKLRATEDETTISQLVNQWVTEYVSNRVVE